MREGTIMKSVLVAVITALLLLMCGCKGGGQSGTPPSGDVAKTGTEQAKADAAMFKENVQPVFSKICAHPECHGTAKSAGMQLSEGVAYDNIVNVTSSEDPHYIRIKPTEPDSS